MLFCYVTSLDSDYFWVYEGEKEGGEDENEVCFSHLDYMEDWFLSGFKFYVAEVS